MNARATLFAVSDSDDLFEYPIGSGDHIEATHFIMWQHRRWLASTTFLRSRNDVRGAALTLMLQSYEQRPMGTLPSEIEELALLAHTPLAEFRDMEAREFGPLRGWHRCRCGDEVRLYHKVTLELVQERLRKRQEGQERARKGATAKRLVRLEQAIEAAGAGQVLRQPGLIDWVDDWLTDNCVGNRTPSQIRHALEAHAQMVLEAKMGADQ